MNVEDTKTAIKTIKEANEERKRLCNTLQGNGGAACDTKKLFREGSKSRLIELGVALIVFPEPTPVSPIVGAGLLAAGAVQKGLRNRTSYAEDIGKDFKKALKDLNQTKGLL